MLTQNEELSRNAVDAVLADHTVLPAPHIGTLTCRVPQPGHCAHWAGSEPAWRSFAELVEPWREILASPTDRVYCLQRRGRYSPYQSKHRRTSETGSFVGAPVDGSPPLSDLALAKAKPIAPRYRSRSALECTDRSRLRHNIACQRATRGPQPRRSTSRRQRQCVSAPVRPHRLPSLACRCRGESDAAGTSWNRRSLQAHCKLSARSGRACEAKSRCARHYRHRPPPRVRAGWFGRQVLSC